MIKPLKVSIQSGKFSIHSATCSGHSNFGMEDKIILVWHVVKKLEQNFYGPFLWMGFNCLKARAPSSRQFIFYH